MHWRRTEWLPLYVASPSDPQHTKYPNMPRMTSAGGGCSEEQGASEKFGELSTRDEQPDTPSQHKTNVMNPSRASAANRDDAPLQISHHREWHCLPVLVKRKPSQLDSSQRTDWCQTQFRNAIPGVCLHPFAKDRRDTHG